MADSKSGVSNSRTWVCSARDVEATHCLFFESCAGVDGGAFGPLRKRETSMSNIVSATPRGVARRDSRYTERALARIDDATNIGLARIEQQTELQVGRVEAVGYMGQRAMHVVAMASQLESQLSQIVPASAVRLQAIGDMVALEAAEIVADTVRRVR